MRIFAWHAARNGLGMPRKRTHSAPLALALDGSLLLNASAQLEPALVARVAQALRVPEAEVFIATRLPSKQRTEALSRLDDAVAEAAARIHGAAPAKPARQARSALKR